MGSSSSCGADVCSLPGSRGDGGAMMRDSYVHHQQNPPVLESMEIVIALVLMAVCWFAWYVARERFCFSNRQIAELGCYLAVSGLAIVGSSILFATARSRREKQWPYPPIAIA